MNNKIEQQKIKSLARKIYTVGDYNRMKILCYIFNKKRPCVSDIAKQLKLSIATTSHHLKILSKEEMLISIREGKNICYTLSKEEIIKDIKNLICKYK